MTDDDLVDEQAQIGLSEGWIVALQRLAESDGETGCLSSVIAAPPAASAASGRRTRSTAPWRDNLAPCSRSWASGH